MLIILGAFSWLLVEWALLIQKTIRWKGRDGYSKVAAVLAVANFSGIATGFLVAIGIWRTW